MPPNAPVPLTIVEIGDDRSLPSPAEFALFLQAVVEFKPAVIAVEPVLKWTVDKKDEEQILIDQAMRVPKLLLAVELAVPSHANALPVEISGFDQIGGRRDKLIKFSGIARQPEEDLQLISTIGFISSANVRSDVRVPLLFEYRGEVVPSFALQAALLWMRIAASEVKIDIGRFVALPNGVKIPIGSDGTALINPNAVRRARHVGLDELLSEAQQHEATTGGFAELENMKKQIVLARTRSRNSAPDVIAATIAALETNSILRRVSWILDCVFVLILAGASGFAQKLPRVDLVLVAIALTAAYCLAALGILSTWSIWLPGLLPIGGIWLVTIFCMFVPRLTRRVGAETATPALKELR